MFTDRKVRAACQVLSTFRERGLLYKYSNATNPFILAKQKKLRICALERSYSMVHPGPQSIQLRDEERRKWQAKLLPCNLWPVAVLKKSLAGKVTTPEESNLLGKQAICRTIANSGLIQILLDSL